jgi:two-component system, LytTR family, sensor kinase
MVTRLLKKRWIRWVLAFAIWTLIGVAFAGQLYLSRSKIGDPVTWSFALGRALADWYVFAVLSIPAMALAQRFPIERSNWPRTLFIHVVGATGFSLSWMVCRAAVEYWQSRGTLTQVSFESAFRHALVATFVFNALIYWALLSVSHALSYYFKYQERELRAAELEKRLAQARLQALQMQLNPHFLFNTLHAISSLMHKDVEAADRMLTRLSDLLRYALSSTDAHEVSLEKELEFLRGYLEIEQIRFGDRLRVRMEIDPAALRARVPNLLLQPLVENAIRHGIEPNARTGIVELKARQSEGALELIIQDNGRGLEKTWPSGFGVGLSNTRARLEQLYGDAQKLELLTTEGGGLTVKIRVPWRCEMERETFA